MKHLGVFTRPVTAVILLSLVAPLPHAQTPETQMPSRGEVVLTKLSPLKYPPLARQTRIFGDVDVLVEVTKDGDVKSAVAVKGHPLLAPAAVDSAQKSQFKCKDCSEGESTLHVLYTFRLLGVEDSCKPPETKPSALGTEEQIPRVDQTLNHVTVVDEYVPICDPGGTIGKVRSVKCLYLWRCMR
jgi:TonB family protein